eukprot:scaffold88632_cov30-Tisochrysis_lutea.AAC.3
MLSTQCPWTAMVVHRRSHSRRTATHSERLQADVGREERVRNNKVRWRVGTNSPVGILRCPSDKKWAIARMTPCKLVGHTRARCRRVTAEGADRRVETNVAFRAAPLFPMERHERGDGGVGLRQLKLRLLQ